MTREEAKEKLYREWQRFLEDNIDYSGISEAYKMAFKSLEQEPVLDKIKAEIEALRKVYPFYNHIDTYVKEDDVRKIIDKYKAESEVVENGD